MSWKYISLEEALWSRIGICEHGRECIYCCWLWTEGVSDTGYAQFHYNGKRYLTSPTMYKLWNNKEIPKGHEICHHCDIRACYNPIHLFTGTRKDNVQDMIRKGRGYNRKANTCNRGHLLTEENFYIRPDGKGRSCKVCITLRNMMRYTK